MSISSHWETEQARAAVVVAHPDDETLWAGGVLLEHPHWEWTIVTLCRRSDLDRAPKFARLLERVGAAGAMEDLDDGPDQAPLQADVVEAAVLSVLPARTYDVIVTHSPFGEYTRHRRHEETSQAVTGLWEAGQLHADEVWMFAYEDAHGSHLPRAISRAPLMRELPTTVWEEKLEIIESVYGFAPDSWEAQTTPRSEAFWCFGRPVDCRSWRSTEGKAR